MPKRKEVQNRTKGNTRPASSSRMADKLAQAGELGRFVGFDSLTGGSSSLDQIDRGPQDSHMHNEGAHFTTALRQLGKKDTTTKLKALTEFVSQCDSQPVSEVKSGLAVWPFMFNKLSTDNDHRVREATHRAMVAFLSKVRADFQPHLKTVMGAWAAGMCDSQTSAATAAVNAFTETFPADKQLQVFQFTFKDIIHYMEDIVLVQTADTYTDPKSYTKDERDRRYEMTVVMAMLGVRHTLEQLSEEFISQKDIVEPIIKKPAFLKLTKHSNPMIRGAFYRLICTYLQKHSSGTVQEKPFCLAVFSGLRESDPSVIVHAWETILVAVNKVENWSQHVNLQKAILPDLWNFLSGGGHGVAKKVYSLLLPLVTALSKIHPYPDAFYSQLLDRIITGLTKDMSRSHSGEEFEAIMSAYVECYNYVMTRTLDDVSEGDNPALEQLVMKISNIVSECFTVDKVSRLIFQIVVQAVYTLISQLLCNHGDSVVVNTYLKQVNSSLLNDITSVVEKINFAKDTHFSRVIDFFTLTSSCQNSQSAVPLCGAAVSDDKKILHKFLQPVVLRTCMICLSTLDQFNSLHHAKLLSLILQQFRTRELLLTVSEMCSFSGDDSAGDTLADLVRFVLKVVVRCQNENNEMVESVVEVLLLVICECPDQLNELLADDAEAVKVMERLSALLLLKKNHMGLEVGNLPAVEYNTEKMVHYINDHCCNKVPFLWQLLETVLATGQQIVPVDRLVSTLDALCGQVSAALSRPTPLGADDLHYCELICKTDSTLLNKVVANLHDLLVKLLIYLCLHSEGSSEVPTHDLDTCYCTISNKLSPQDYFNSLLPKLLDHVATSNTSLTSCFGLAMKMLKFHAGVDVNVLLSSMTYDHQIDVVPVAMVERICYGKLLLQPQTISIGSFENIPTNDTIPKSLYGTVIVAVFCSSTSESLLSPSKVSVENSANALISLGLISLFLESPLIDDIDKRFCNMVKLATQKLFVRASKGESLTEVFDSLVKRCCNSYILMESLCYVLHCVEELTTEESLSLQSALIRSVPVTQLCTKLSGICNSNELKDKIVTSHSTDNDNVLDGLAISLLLTQSSFADDSSWQFANDQVKSLMDQQHHLEFDNFGVGSCVDIAHLSLEVFTKLITSGRVDDACWDFILCSTVTMMQLCDDKVEATLPASVLHCATLRLCIQLDMFFASSTNQQMVTEWKDFFCPAIGDAAVVQFKHILKCKNVTIGHFVAVEEFLCCKLLCRLCTEPSGHFNMSELMDHLSADSYPVQVTAYHLLTRMMKVAIFSKKDDTVDLSDWVTTLKSQVMFFQDKLPSSPSSADSNTVGYMLSWLLCISYLRDTSHSSEAHMQFLEWTKESGVAQALVCELITHIPLQSFSSHDQIEVTPIADIANLSMITFKAVAQQLPVALRQWFITLDRKAGNIVEDFTKKYITPLLWKDQVTSFEASPKSFDNMEVRLGKETQEVMIKYRIDDTAGIELIMLLSDVHPLYLPTITQERGIKVNIGNWKKWILQLNSYIGNQNGTLLQGLAIWKANLDKHFAGMEDCMICFSVIHHSNQSLPRLTCKTCKKKFHNICLYKWFSTSTKSTCPLCRNIF